MNAVAKKNEAANLPIRQVPNVGLMLINDKAREQLATVAAKHLNPERLMRVVANAIRTTPKLQQCEPMSFLGALMQCAALGLEPNTILGHAYLIPFDNSRKVDGKWVKIPEVQLVVGYKGLIDLARRSGHITSISANIHYSDDELWEYEEGTEAQLRHRPGAQDGKKLHAYAIAKFKDGGHAYVVLPWKHVMKIRDGSQGWKMAVSTGKTDKNPWGTHEDAMAMKTAVRALAKYLPLSVEFADAMAVDEKRADYRAFAMDPTSGIQIEGEAEEAEGDFDGDTGEVQQIEQARTIEPEPEKKRESTPRRDQQARPDTGAYVDSAKPKTEPKAEPALDLEPAKKAEPEKAAPRPTLESSYWRQVIADAKDIGADGATELHADAIERLRVEHPTTYADLMEMMTADQG